MLSATCILPTRQTIGYARSRRLASLLRSRETAHQVTRATVSPLRRRNLLALTRWRWIARGISTLAMGPVSGESSRMGRFVLWPVMVFLSARAEALLRETADPLRPRNLPFLADSRWIAPGISTS